MGRNLRGGERPNPPPPPRKDTSVTTRRDELREALADTRECLGCHTTMGGEWFASMFSIYCTACEDQKLRDRPWTPEETRRLVAAGSGVLRLWSQTFGQWDEPSLMLWRELTDALDRRVYERDGG
jgi:hypothetical protein